MGIEVREDGGRDIVGGVKGGGLAIYSGSMIAFYPLHPTKRRKQLSDWAYNNKSYNLFEHTS